MVENMHFGPFCHAQDRGTSPGLPGSTALCSAAERHAEIPLACVPEGRQAINQALGASVLTGQVYSQSEEMPSIDPADSLSRLPDQPGSTFGTSVTALATTYKAAEAQESQESGTTARTTASGYESLPSPQSMVELSPRLPSPAAGEPLLTCPPPGQTIVFRTPSSSRTDASSPSSDPECDAACQGDERWPLQHYPEWLLPDRRTTLVPAKMTSAGADGQSSYISMPSTFVPAHTSGALHSHPASVHNTILEAQARETLPVLESSPEPSFVAQALSPRAKSQLWEEAEQNQRKLKHRRSQSPGTLWGEGAFGLQWPVKSEKSRPARPRQRPERILAKRQAGEQSGNPRMTHRVDTALTFSSATGQGIQRLARQTPRASPTPPEQAMATSRSIICKAALVTFADIDGSSEACSVDQADVREVVQAFLMQECDDFDM